MLTNDYVPGAPSWLDLGSGDLDRAKDFYRALFGWEFASAGPGAGGYGMFLLAGQSVAGLGPIAEDGAVPAWTVYFETADVDATTEAVRQAGGTVRFEPFDVQGQARFAGYADPGGAQFAAFQPGTTRGLDRVGPHALCWTELYTPDGARAVWFYAEVFGWDTEDMPLAGDAGAYTVVSRAGGGRQGSHGGIMQLPVDMLPSGTGYWQPYFAVPDADATVTVATARGATVLMPAANVEGVGRVALLKDAEGASFAVLAPAQQAA